MALSFPLSLDDFFDGLKIESVTLRLGPARNRSPSATGGGELIVHQVGARLWQGEIALSSGLHADQAAVEALLSMAEEPAASFLLYDHRLPGPSTDPDGSILGAANVTIASVASDMQGVGLQGLPAAYEIPRGTLIGWTYGSGPPRYALHRTMESATADGAGDTPEVQVTPYVREGVSVGTSVTLHKPVCKARLVTADYGTRRGRGRVTDGPTFSWRQTLR